MTCTEISVIPQLGPTCWFNAILMSSFYSQLLRLLLINKTSKTWIDKQGNEKSIFKFFKTILKHSYDTKDKKIIKQFNRIKPDELLLHILNKNNSALLSYLIKTDNLAWHSNYIYEFLKFLNVNVLYLTYMNNKKIIANFDRKLSKLKKDFFTFSDEVYEEKFDEISNAINGPDVIIFEHYDLYKDPSLVHFYDMILKKNTRNNVYDIELIYDLKHDIFKDLIDLKEEIDFRGNIYKLDSILLNDYDSRHVIAGITCNNEKYVYNGWNIETTDPSFASNKKDYIEEPCKLMKYDWNINNTNEFCLNAKDCKLDKITDRSDLCFSFNKGLRLLIYVKISPITSSSLSSLSSSSFKSFSPSLKEELKKTLKNEIDNIDEIEIDKRLDKIDPNKIKLPLELKRKIILYNLYDKNKIDHHHINVDIKKYVHETYDFDKLFEKNKLKLGHFYLPDEINKDIHRINFYKHFQLDFSHFDENIYDIIKSKLRLTPITDISKYDSTKIMNINGENYDIQTLFYYYFIVHLETTFDNIINNKIEIDLRDLKKIYESQISLDEIINNKDIISDLKKIFKFNKNIEQIIDYKLIVKLFGIEFISLYLTKEKRTLEDLIKFLNDSNESDKKRIVSLFNVLNLVSNNISNIEELIEFLNKQFGKKIGGKSRIIKRLLKIYKY